MAPDPETREGLRSVGRASAIGIEFAASVVGGLVVGWWADGKLGTTPWLALIGLMLGSFVGFKALYRLAKQLEGSSSEKDSGSEKASSSEKERRDGS